MNRLAEDVTDSRSNVVGRKRALHTSSEQGREVISIDSSSDESLKQPRKRAKQDTETAATYYAQAEVDLTSSPLQDEPARAVKSGANIGQPVAWNQGVQNGLRTSFQRKQPSSSQNSSFKQPEQGANNNGQGFLGPQSAKVDLNTVEKFGGASNHKSISSKNQFKKLKGDKQLAVMTAYTHDVSTLIDLHGWPLPQELQQSCMKYIEEGLTFYPTPNPKDQPMGKYSWRGSDVHLREMHDMEGRPIMIEHITYPDVVRALVADNKDLQHILTEKRAKAAFKAYLTHFYNHVPKREIFASSLMEKTLSLEEILKNSEPNAAPARASGKSAPPTLARAVDHYDSNVLPSIGNNRLVEYEAPIEHNNASASNSTTEFIGQKSTKLVPTLVTNVIDPTRDHRILTGADKVGSEMDIPSNGGSGGKVDYDQDFEASRETGSSPELTPGDRAAILKYFPATDGIVLRRCLVCGSSGHERAECPHNACSSCGSKGDHLTPACPQTIVCGKCRGVGHQISHCPEKLRAAKEDIKCITCQSPSHHENQCHFIWRSFLPGPDEIKRVRDISVYCYFCGRSGHFGPECGIHHGTPASGGLSWSKYNLEKYLDGPTSYDAMSAGGKAYSIPSRAKKGFSIKGKANDPIELDDSDDDNDDDDDFIHPKVNMGPRNGQISFSQAGGMQSFNQTPFQFQANVGGDPNSRAPSRNQGGRGGRGGGGGGGGGRGGRGGGSGGEKKKPKHKSGNSPPRGGGSGRGRGGRGGPNKGPARGAPRGRH
ncbi:hypothetical protein SBOR_5185 [Sclerotinia borealis F-4128]|uniref:CCHC-type domain-containing protein n=1 Tax=Sclerotinia borealis (strain F-4128) TaxID=1432307 RepID=W9CCI9_SCLBF|nr:hypothetical protein SBOR_5185 [Sclerotinia borealis F-4128]